MAPLLLGLADADFAARFAGHLGAEQGVVETRRFPDGETYMRIATPLAGRQVIVLATLDRPDDKLLPLIFLADAARDLGAAGVGLAAPYLPYMRQDTRFLPGEAVTSVSFAALLSRAVDWLVTIDPHLHRHASLSEIYSIPARVLHAAPLISAWIRDNLDAPVLLGPDSESRQWVDAVASDAGAPSVVLDKTRHGDREVAIELPDLDAWRDHTPVLVDDIVSSGATMVETVRGALAAGLRAPVCIGVHGLFADDAYRHLLDAGAAQVVTCNTVPHDSNGIDVAELMAAGVSALMPPAGRG